MDDELTEIGASLPRRFQELSDDDINAIRLAQSMFARHGYYMALYHCTTLAIHCHQKDRQNRILMGDIAFWFKVRSIVQKMKPS
jgi:hypothetical protein